MGKLWSRPTEKRLESFIEYVRAADKDLSEYQVIQDACKASGLKFDDYARLHYREETFRHRFESARYIYPEVKRLLEGL